MELEKIVDLKKLDRKVSQRNKVVANLQIRGNWFFQLFKDELKSFDISEVQFNILKVLNVQHPDPVPSSEIAQLLISQASDVTRIVDRMVKKGWVVRCTPPENRRLVLVSLTEEGVQKLIDTKDVVGKVMRRTEVWSDEEVQVLNNLLNRLG